MSMDMTATIRRIIHTIRRIVVSRVCDCEGRRGEARGVRSVETAECSVQTRQSEDGKRNLSTPLRSDAAKPKVVVHGRGCTKLSPLKGLTSLCPPSQGFTDYTRERDSVTHAV